MDTKNQVEEDVDKPDWRLTFSSESRQRVVAKVEASLRKYISDPSPEKFQEVKEVAARFEDKIFSIATSTEDYVRRITTKMFMVNKAPTGEASSLPSNSSCNSQITDSASHSVQSQVRNQAQSSVFLMSNQPQPIQQKLLSDNMENSMSSPGIQNSGNLVSSLPLGTHLTDNSVARSLGQSYEMQIVSGMLQTQNTYSNSQRQVHERQHLQQVIAQQNPQSQNQNQFVFQQQFQPPSLKKNRGDMQNSSVKLHDPQQQHQHNLMQMQMSSAMQQAQSSMVQSASQSGVIQNQQPSALQQHSQSVMWQQQSQCSFHEQQTSTAQPIILSSQQKQLIGKQTDERNFQPNQLFGQPNNAMEMQKQRHKWLGQHNNPSSMQHQQQVGCQQNDISRFHQQTLGMQGNVSGKQQQQQFGNQSGISNLQTHQQSVHSLHQAKSATHQQSQHTSSMLLPSQGQQVQSSRQQQMTQIQQHKQMQQQLASENKSNSLQRGSLQHQNSNEWQRQLLQLQQVRHDPSSTSTDSMGVRGYSSASGDVQDEVVNKAKSMMEIYLPQLNEILHRINIKLQQSRPEEIEILKKYKMFAEKYQGFLRTPLVRFHQSSLEKLIPHEKQLQGFINMPNLRKALQLPSEQLSPSQMTQLKHTHNNQVINKSQLQSRILRNPQLTTMNQNVVPSIQPHGSMSLLNQVGISPGHPSSMINSLQHSPALESGQGNCLIVSQQGGASVGRPVQKNIVGVSQQAENINTMSQNNMSLLPANMIQHQHSKQQQSHNMTRQQHQRQSMHQQEQHILKNQQLQRQQKLQPTHSLPQHHTHMSETCETNVRSSSISGTTFQHHLSPSQDATVSNLRQIKTGSSHVSSPQLLQAGSPQISQNSSPLIDQQSMITSLSKIGTPLQSVNSPSVCLSPSTPMASSPLPGKAEKQNTGLSSLSNAGSIGQAPPVVSSLPQAAQSNAVGTPGISASPLLEDFINAESNQDAGTALVIIPEKPVLTPTERLRKAVKSISSKALSASMEDIGLAVSMVEGFAGSRPGEGSRHSVPEDLVATAKMHVQSMNFDLINDNLLKKKLKRCYSTESSLKRTSSDSTENNSSKKVNSFEIPEQLRSTATSGVKRSRLEMSRALQEEIGEINYRLINTVLDISKEDMNLTSTAGDNVEGRIVKCTFSPIGSSAKMFPVLPIRFLISANYPYCSPILIDKLSANQSNEYEDLLTKTTIKFNTSLRCMAEPISLKEMAKSWDSCAYAVFLEYARQNGGGSFSSIYGTWEKCVGTGC